MPEKNISVVVAENLKWWMDQAGVTQTALAEQAGVSQKTISNYLNPEQRIEGAKGKFGSPKLHELDLIAKALGVEVWQLTRQMTEPQRTMYEAIERAYKGLLDGAPPASPQPTDTPKRAAGKKNKPAGRGAA